MLEETIMGEIEDTAKELASTFINENAATLAVEYADMVSSLGPKEKELAGKIAIVKSTETDEMSLDEVMEYNDLLNECAKLNMEISEELSDFWGKIADLAKEASTKFVDITVKVASKALIAAILV
jgi:hypothetical protein